MSHLGRDDGPRYGHYRVTNWTAPGNPATAVDRGIGFQAGVERLGAMAIPTGPGNTEKQIEMMLDLKTTVFCSTSSYALLLAEEIQRRGLLDQINLRLGIIGSERWGDKMRGRIEEMLGIETFDS
jgi:phenylacetate-CoA ligase